MSCGIPRISFCGVIHGILNLAHDVAYRRRGKLKEDEIPLCVDARAKWIAGGRSEDGDGGWYSSSSRLMDGTYARCTDGVVTLCRGRQRDFAVDEPAVFAAAERLAEKRGARLAPPQAVKPTLIANNAPAQPVTRLTRAAEQALLPKPSEPVVPLIRIGTEKAKVLR